LHLYIVKFVCVRVKDSFGGVDYFPVEFSWGADVVLAVPKALHLEGRQRLAKEAQGIFREEVRSCFQCASFDFVDGHG
jgi:hypothetical protein